MFSAKRCAISDMQPCCKQSLRINILSLPAEVKKQKRIKRFVKNMIEKQNGYLSFANEAGQPYATDIRYR